MAGKYPPGKDPKSQANLVQNREFAPEVRRAWQEKATAASHARRRELKAQRDILRDLMKTDCTDEETRAALVSLGMEPSIANAVNLAVLKRAQTGDIEAARYVRDTIGEKPTEMTALQVSSQPVRAMDLTQLSDAELEALADQSDADD